MIPKCPANWTLPLRLPPNGQPHSTVFQLYDAADGVLLAEVTQDAHEDEEDVVDTLWAVCEGLRARMDAGAIKIASYDGATGWPL